QVGMGHDAGSHARGPILAAGRLRSDAVDEFGFTHRTHGLGAICAIHGFALDEYGGHDVVAAAGIAQQLFEHVAMVRVVPQVVVGIDDGQVRVDDVFLNEVQPVVAQSHFLGRGAFSFGHASVSVWL